jgi:hypothetical protein
VLRVHKRRVLQQGMPEKPLACAQDGVQIQESASRLSGEAAARASMARQPRACRGTFAPLTRRAARAGPRRHGRARADAGGRALAGAGAGGRWGGLMIQH